MLFWYLYIRTGLTGTIEQEFGPDLNHVPYKTQSPIPQLEIFHDYIQIQLFIFNLIL